MQWDTVGGYKFVKFDPPKNYPKEMIPFDGKLQPIKLSFQSLKSAISLVTTKILDKLWVESSVQSYLSSFSINISGYNDFDVIVRL